MSHVITDHRPLTPMCSGKPLIKYFAKSADSDEMQHIAAFHQGLCCLLREKRSSYRTFLKNTIFFENYNLTHLDMYNGLSQVYCINPAMGGLETLNTHTNTYRHPNTVARII